MSWKSKRRRIKRRKNKSTLTPQKHLYNLVYSVQRRGNFSGDIETVRTWLNEILAKDTIICCYCFNTLDFLVCSVDHDIPISREGPNSLDNLRVCCKFCNKAKGDMTGEEYRALLMAIREFDDEGKRVLKRLVAAGNMFRRWRR